MIQRDYATARTFYEEGLQRSNVIGDKVLIASCLEGLAAAVVAQGGEGGPVSDSCWAAQLWGAAERLREAIGAPVPPAQRAVYQQALALAHLKLSEQAFRKAWEEGRSMAPEQVLATRPPAKTSLPAPASPRSPAAAPKPATAAAGLTAREAEVLRLLTAGLTNPQIAERLVLSLPTVNSHVASIFNKLGVNSRSAATRYALEHHLV
jgi:DNA-binding CsgD family transcriptional regulator